MPNWINKSLQDSVNAINGTSGYKGVLTDAQAQEMWAAVNACIVKIDRIRQLIHSVEKELDAMSGKLNGQSNRLSKLIGK